MHGRILSAKVIHKVDGKMDGWPTLIRKKDGELMVIFSGDRRFHACPYGKTFLIRSRDNGESWSPESVINNTRLDDRDAGLVETPGGALVMTWFTSIAFESPEIMRWVFPDPEIVKREMAKWQDISDALTDEVRTSLLGSWSRRCPSGDGIHWEDPVYLPCSTPHGPIVLKDGRLLMVGKETYGEWGGTLQERLKFNGNGLGELRVIESRDDGKSWNLISVIDSKETPTACEPSVVECSDGTLVAMFRNEEPFPGYPPCLAQAESYDGGFTWTPARKTLIGGLPPHLLRLADGRLLLTLGRRFPPLGQFAAISPDNGKTWCDAFPIAPEAPAVDHGYPSSVQMPDGSILTAYYESEYAESKPVVKLSHWVPED